MPPSFDRNVLTESIDRAFLTFFMFLWGRWGWLGPEPGCLGLLCWAGLGCAWVGVGWVGLGWAGLGCVGWAGLDWAAAWAGLGWVGVGQATTKQNSFIPPR